jgi:tetratricopeptide (TPR) repeat protein
MNERSIDPERDPAAEALAEAVRLAARGETAAALGALSAAVFGPELEPAARAFESELLERLDRWGDAWTVLDAALARHPDHPGLALRAGVSCLRRGDLAAARIWLARAWSQGALPEAAFRLGELSRAEGRGDERRWWALATASEGAGGEWRRRADERLAGGSGS